MMIKKMIRSPKRTLSLVLLAMIGKLFNRGFKRSAKTFWGDEMRVVIPEHVSLRIFGFGYFEEGLTRMILEYLKPGDTFFDIGAHFGYFTLLGSSIVGETGEVHAFEPTPCTFAVLQSNVEGRNNVVLNKSAVFSKNTTLSFNDYGTEYSAFNCFEDVGLNRSSLQKFEVQAISLDEYIDGKKIVPNFIKIDAEGAEYEVLQGGKTTIKDFQPIISIEVGGKNSVRCIVSN
jgi:FkbM family methyltransferase